MHCLTTMNDFNREMERISDSSNHPKSSQPKMNTSSNLNATEGDLDNEDRLAHLIAASHQPDFAGLGTSASDETLRQYLTQQQQKLNTLNTVTAKQIPILPKNIHLSHVPEPATSEFSNLSGISNSFQNDQSNNESLYNLKLTQFEAKPAVGTQNFQFEGNQSNADQNLDSGLLLPPRLKRKMHASTEVIDEANIQDKDVLLERGGRGNHHGGSKHYRRLINENRESYQILPNTAKTEKMAISVGIIKTLKDTGARFIHKKDGQYIIMNDREARNKISQALREKKIRVMLDD